MSIHLNVFSVVMLHRIMSYIDNSLCGGIYLNIKF